MKRYISLPSFLSSFAFTVLFVGTFQSTCSAQNLIENGSFEVPATAAGTTVFFFDGSTDLPGWALSSLPSANPRTVSVQRVGTEIPGAATDGLQSMIVQADFGHGSASQTFATETGHRYRVSFDYRVQTRGFGGPLDLRFAVGPLAEVFDTPTPGTNWMRYAESFVASGSQTTIIFQNFTSALPDGNVDLWIDNVSVMPADFDLQIEVSQVRITWASLVGESYKVQYRSALTVGQWTDLTPSPILGNGETLTILDNVPRAEGRRFYQVVAAP